MKAQSLQVQTVIVVVFVVSAVFGAVSSGTQVAAADDLKISQLEQEVRELQRDVQRQARRIDALESVARQSRVGQVQPPSSLPPAVTKPSVANAAWLQNANWDKLRPGMTEAEVLRELGPPTTSRRSENGDTQTLFYAMELEAGGLLSGQVVLADRRVIETHKPALK